MISIINSSMTPFFPIKTHVISSQIFTGLVSDVDLNHLDYFRPSNLHYCAMITSHVPKMTCAPSTEPAVPLRLHHGKGHVSSLMLHRSSES